MYHDYSVAVPEVPGKIVFMKRGGCVYVYVELDRVYYADKGYNSAQRALIGKLVDASDRTKMYPNLNYDKLFGAEQVAHPAQSELQAQPPRPAQPKSKSKVKAKAKTKAQAPIAAQPSATSPQAADQDLVKWELWVPRLFAEVISRRMAQCRLLQGLELSDIVVKAVSLYMLEVFNAELGEKLRALGCDPEVLHEIAEKMLQACPSEQDQPSE